MATGKRQTVDGEYLLNIFALCGAVRTFKQRGAPKGYMAESAFRLNDDLLSQPAFAGSPKQTASNQLELFSMFMQSERSLFFQSPVRELRLTQSLFEAHQEADEEHLLWVERVSQNIEDDYRQLMSDFGFDPGLQRRS